MKILITGANGMLGSNLCTVYSRDDKNEVIATGIEKPKFSKCKNYRLDITDESDLEIIEKEKPDMIVHCAALVNVDYCEDHKDEAEKVNAIGTKNIAEAAKKAESYLVHISTDAVFDGEKGNYKEEDKAMPINVYGQTKLDAEKYVEKVGGNYVIVRTNIYGWNREEKFSLGEWMLNKLEKNEELPAFKDVIFSPILVNNLGEVIIELYKIRYRGILHVAGSQPCSKLEFAKAIAKIFGLKEELIKETSVNDINLKAKRAKNMSLNVDKAERTLKTKLLDVEEGLKQFKELKEKDFVKELKNG
jgi:dTDP-4-dehydrorhamnose reductase